MLVRDLIAGLIDGDPDAVAGEDISDDEMGLTLEIDGRSVTGLIVDYVDGVVRLSTSSDYIGGSLRLPDEEPAELTADEEDALWAEDSWQDFLHTLDD